MSSKLNLSRIKTDHLFKEDEAERHVTTLPRRLKRYVMRLSHTNKAEF